MPLVYYVIYSVGVALLVLVLSRGVQVGLCKHYPYFYAYVGYLLLLNITHFVLAQIQSPSYAIVYWLSDAIGTFLSFLVAWEIFRHAFPVGSVLRQVASLVLAILLVGLAGSFLLGSGTPGGVFADMERKVGLGQAVLLGAILVLTRYYAIALGLNVWGMALGLGMYVSVSVVNFAAFELLDSFFPFWRTVRPTSFVAMLAVWTWAMWSYAPNLEPNLSRIQESERHLAEWKHAWKQIRATLRKASGL